MFSIFKKKPDTVDLSFIGVDMHSHLLPALDDGLQTVADSVSFIKELYALGYKKLICTPHILSGVHNNSPQTILPALEKIRKELIRQNIPVQIEAAAEYMVDHEFDLLIEKKEPLLTFGKKNYILIEMSYVAASPNIENVIFQLKLLGLHPVIAHPERYNYYHEKFDVYTDLKDRGCFFQVNFLSLSGYYGYQVKHAAEKLMHYGMIDFIGTDMHHVNHLRALKESVAHKSVRETIRKAELLNLTLLD
jgi:tyrosine-protein phosphatase YwqE